MNGRQSVVSILTLLLLSLIPGCDQEDPDIVKRPGHPDLIKTPDQVRMDAAMAEAKSTLDSFVTALEAKPAGAANFAIKKGFEYGTDGLEYIWITEVRRDGDGFLGRVNNEPVNPVKVKIGQVVPVPRAEVADWMFMADGKLQGGYTIVALSWGSDRQAQYEEEMGIDWSKYEFLRKPK